MKIRKILSIMAVSAMFAGILQGCASKANEGGTFTILNGTFSEITILGNMAGILIEENTDLEVVYHDSMNTVAAGNAVEKKEVDLYVSYDGTLLTTLLGHDPSDVPEGEDLYVWANEAGKEERGLMLVSKFGFENTYALAVKNEYAEANNVDTISSLKPFTKDLVFGSEHEFFDEEGTMRFNPFNAHYGIEWKDSASIDIGLKYSAIDNGNIDVTMVYSTDGLNKKSNLRILTDDQKFFPQYYGAYLTRETIFEEFKETAPNLEEVLTSLEGKISTEEMIDLNYAVDADGRDPNEVAKEFLVSKGLSK